MAKRTKRLKTTATNALLQRLRKISPRMRAINLVASALSLAFAIMALWALDGVLHTTDESNEKGSTYSVCQSAADELMQMSDYLTAEARLYVTTGNLEHLENYLAEVLTQDRRGGAIDILRENAPNQSAIEALELARTYSNELATVELRALRLACDAKEVSSPPIAIQGVELTPREQALSNDQKLERAHKLLHDEAYSQQKLDIHEQVQVCSNQLVGTLRSELDSLNATLDTLISILRANVISLLIVVVFVVSANALLVLWPMRMHEASIRDDEPLVPAGARELRLLTHAYNDMYEKNHSITMSLRHEAHYDALTGLLNRGAYDDLLFRHRHNCALILVDVDNFKTFNDEYGHEMGDAILIEVAATLYASFRSTDHVCRIGGDEFAVIMVDGHEELREVIAHKVAKVSAFLRDTSNGLPSVTISVGVGYGVADTTVDELFQAADSALYETKRNGRDGLRFANELPK